MSKFRKCRKSSQNTSYSLREVGKAYVTVKVNVKVHGQTKKTSKHPKNPPASAGACVGWVGANKLGRVGGKVQIMYKLPLIQ